MLKTPTQPRDRMPDLLAHYGDKIKPKDHRHRPQDAEKVLSKLGVSGVEFEHETGIPINALTGSEIYRIANLDGDRHSLETIRKRFSKRSRIPAGGSAARGSGNRSVLQGEPASAGAHQVTPPKPPIKVVLLKKSSSPAGSINSNDGADSHAPITSKGHSMLGLSPNARILFLKSPITYPAKATEPPAKPRQVMLLAKSHVKQFTRKDGTIVKEHDDKRTKQMAQAPVGRDKSAPPESAPPAKDPEDVRGAAHGYGTHNIEEGDTIHFKAGEFSGKGQVKSIGKDGAVVEDESGRAHNVHWHEVTGFKAERGDGGGNKPPSEGGKPVAEGDGPEKKPAPAKPVVLGKQDPIPAESFSAADYAKSHDQADVTAESVLSGFPSDTKEKVAMAVDRVKNIEETLKKFFSDGKWSVERQELHRKIIYDGVTVKGKKVPGLLSPERVAAARPAKGENPTFIILGGRGGSGKSSFEGEVYEPERCIVLDADHIKSMLPEYEGWNASQVHEESGELFDHIADFARIMGLNVVLDKTMKTAKSAIADVEKFKKAGYRTEAHYMHLPRQEAAKRAVKRFLDGGENGRFVPPEVVLANTGNEAAFDQVSKMVDAWSFRDNNVAYGEKPILISQNGEPAMKRKEIMQKALEKRMILVWRKTK